MSEQKRRSEWTGLVAFDLDGTLLRGPTVCEVLAGGLGHLERMREFETITTESDMAAARLEMTRWYRGIPIAELTATLDFASLAPKTAEGIRLLREHGFEIAIA